MNLTFIEKLVNCGINCSTKNGDNLINKEGLIAVIKDSCERNGIDNVLSVLTAGPDLIDVDYDVIKKYLIDYYKTSKDHNVVKLNINYVSCTISGRTEYKRLRYCNPKDQTDYRSRKDDIHTIEDWYDDYDNFELAFDYYYDLMKRMDTPVEE